MASLLIGTGLLLSACADRHHERIIVVDPGHGGIDPGAIGSSGNVLEKDVTLRVGLALRDQLEATGRYRVIMTRDDDRTVRLCDRLQIARRGQGELLISIHADSLTTAPEVGGAAVYMRSEATSAEEPPRSARKRECAELRTGIALSSHEDRMPETPIGLAQEPAESMILAELLVQELNGATRMARRRPVGERFVVLQAAEMPSVLVEFGYLSNPTDERALADHAHIARLASAVARALDLYYGVDPS